MVRWPKAMAAFHHLQRAAMIFGPADKAAMGAAIARSTRFDSAYFLVKPAASISFW